MTSPHTLLPPLSANSPYPFPSFIPSPAALPADSPFPFPGLTPIPPQPQPAPSQTASIRPPASEVNLEDMSRALGEVGRMLERAEEVLREIGRLDGGFFGEEREGMQLGLEGLPRLQGGAGRYECDDWLTGRHECFISNVSCFLRIGFHQRSCVPDVQLLHSLIPLATSSLLGALPVPLSPAPLSQSSPSMTELASWAEERAGLEFGRREAVRASSRAVLDVLKGSGR
jgi:hypothetical protein